MHYLLRNCTEREIVDGVVWQDLLAVPACPVYLQIHGGSRSLRTLRLWSLLVGEGNQHRANDRRPVQQSTTNEGWLAKDLSSDQHCSADRHN